MNENTWVCLHVGKSIIAELLVVNQQQVGDASANRVRSLD